MILVIGGTGTIGSEVVRALATQVGDITVVSARGRSDALPANVSTVAGDVRDTELMRDLLARTRTLFVLHPVVADELTRALVTLALADDAGIERVVYLSMIGADTFTDVPHAAAKYAAERMLFDRAIPASILRACYFHQNDVAQKTSLVEHGVYAMPIGDVGVEMIDARDIAEVAARELVKRDRAEAPLPPEIIEVVGPEALTGEDIARLWSEQLARPIRYAADLDAFERAAQRRMPDEMAYDLTLMLRRFHESGYQGSPGAAERLAARLGRPLRTYRAFAEEQRDAWLGAHIDAGAGAPL